MKPVSANDAMVLSLLANVQKFRKDETTRNAKVVEDAVGRISELMDLLENQDLRPVAGLIVKRNPASLKPTNDQRVLASRFAETPTDDAKAARRTTARQR